jgi:hypothetical protein
VGSVVFGSGAGSYTIGNVTGNALLLSSGGSISNSIASTSNELIQAPLVLEPVDSTSNGTYSFSDLSTTKNSNNALTFGGAITGGTTTGNITLNLFSVELSSLDVYSNISNGNASSVSVTSSSPSVSSTTAGSVVLGGTNTYTGATIVNSSSITSIQAPPARL